VSPEERLGELEAENARLLAMVERQDEANQRQADANRRLLALAERQIAALEVMAGIEPVEAEESTAGPRLCRTRPPARRYRRAQGGAR